MLRKQIIDLLEKFAELSGYQVDHFDLHDQKFRYADEFDDRFDSFFSQLLDVGEFARFNFDLRTLPKEEFAAFARSLTFPIIVIKKSEEGLIPLLLDVSRAKSIHYFEDKRDGFLEGNFGSEEQLLQSVCTINDLRKNHAFSEERYLHLNACQDNDILFISGFKVYSGLLEEKHHEELSPVKRFFLFLKTEKKDIYNVYFFAIMIALVNLTLPLGIQAIIGLMSGGLLLESVFVLMVLVVVATIASGWLQVQQLSMVEILQQRVFTRTAFDFAFRIPRLKMAHLRNQYAPELVNRFFDVLNVQKSLPKILIDFTSAIVQIIFGLLLLSFYHPYFILFGLLVIFIIFLVFYFTSKKGLETSIYESKYKYKVVYWLEELGRGIQSFKLAGFANLPMHKTDRLLDKYLYYRKKHFSILVKQFTAIIAFKTLITAGLLILGGALVFNRQINLGQFVASEIIIVLVISSVEKLISSVSVVYDILTALDKIGHVTDMEIEQNAGRDVSDLDIENRFELKIENLTYKFEDAREPSIKNVSMQVSGKQKICIAGFNDSGKTTLVKTIAGLFDDFGGVIRLNDISIREINPNSYRDIIGDNLTVADVFEGTIEENITMGRNGILLKDILRACELVGLNPFISSLEKGLQAEVLPSGSNFPSNVVKKILLARSLVGNPRLILIDEFFHNVQSVEKLALIDTLFKGNFAMVIVSSIPEIMKRSDYIYVLKEGSIYDQGSFDELKSRRSLPIDNLQA